MDPGTTLANLALGAVLGAARPSASSGSRTEEAQSIRLVMLLVHLCLWPLLIYVGH